MAYSPGQPWDPSLSYTCGQTCTYNGLKYVYWHGTEPSTVGKNPTEDMKDFPIIPFGFSNPPYPKASERAWVLADWVVDAGGNVVTAGYGDVRALQGTIRGSGYSDSTNTQRFIYDYFAETTGARSLGGKTETAPLFYEYPSLGQQGYNFRISYSDTSGIPDPPLFPPVFTDWNISGNYAALTGAPPGVTIGPGEVAVGVIVGGSGGLPNIGDDYMKVGQDNQRINLLNNLLGCLNCFDRKFHYKREIKWFAFGGIPLGEWSIELTLDTGPVRDGFLEMWPYQVYTVPSPPPGTYTASDVVTFDPHSPTPPYQT